jgi:exonuclease SbcC
LKEEKNLKDERDRLEVQYQKYKEVWELQQELFSFENKYEELKSKETLVDEERNKFKRGTNAAAVKPFIDNEEETGRKIEQSLKDIDRYGLLLGEIQERLKHTESQYNEAYDKKEKELPILIDREARLNQALEINKAINAIGAEREALLCQYRNKDAEIKSIQAEIDGIDKQKGETQQLIEKCEQRINEIRVEPEHREKVAEAAGVEKEYNALNEQMNKYLKERL